MTAERRMVPAHVAREHELRQLRDTLQAAANHAEIAGWNRLAYTLREYRGQVATALARQPDEVATDG